jgi:hypothetical protein
LDKLASSNNPVILPSAIEDAFTDKRRQSGEINAQPKIGYTYHYGPGRQAAGLAGDLSAKSLSVEPVQGDPGAATIILRRNPLLKLGSTSYSFCRRKHDDV